MLQKTRSRDGFTLAEILVVLAILAALAAVLVPVVIGQIRKGDISRVTADLDATRAGIEAFIADVRRYPAYPEQLNTLITTTDTSIVGGTYPTGLTTKWDGPYLNKSFVSAQLPTGFGGYIVGDSSVVVAFGATNYLAVLVKGIGEDDFNDIDEVIDGTTNSSTGQLRFTAADTTIRYLVVPIN